MKIFSLGRKQEQQHKPQIIDSQPKIVRQKDCTRGTLESTLDALAAQNAAAVFARTQKTNDGKDITLYPDTGALQSVTEYHDDGSMTTKFYNHSPSSQLNSILVTHADGSATQSFYKDDETTLEKVFNIGHDGKTFESIICYFPDGVTIQKELKYDNNGFVIQTIENHDNGVPSKIHNVLGAGEKDNEYSYNEDGDLISLTLFYPNTKNSRSKPKSTILFDENAKTATVITYDKDGSIVDKKPLDNADKIDLRMYPQHVV